MISSQDIASNKRFPVTIRSDAAFKTPREFDKVFGSIGLSNFHKPIDKFESKVPFVTQQGLFSLRLNRVGAIKNSWWRNMGWTVVGTGLLYAELFLDVVDYLKFKSHNKNLSVTFSADGTDGAWDIATMSMRGIRSCQSWDHRRSNQLVGSIIDPCCGIIYLSGNRKNTYGSIMEHRAVVRYVVHESLGPCLYLEKIYSASPTPDHDIRAITFLFASMLHRRSGLPIAHENYMANDLEIKPYISIPLARVVNEHMRVSSYRDSKITYKRVPRARIKSFGVIKKFESQFLFV